MAKRRRTVSRAVWRVSHSAWPSAAEALQRMADRAITALRPDADPSSRRAVSRVLFACRDAGRSQMAVAFFNELADSRRARAIPAATDPSGTVDPNVIEAMRETGVELAPSLPRRLNAPLAMAAGHLVTMGSEAQGPFFAGVKVEDWPIDDPKGQPVDRVREIRDEIRRRVAAMIDAHGWGRDGR
jgi:arsenate reductase